MKAPSLILAAAALFGSVVSAVAIRSGTCRVNDVHDKSDAGMCQVGAMGGMKPGAYPCISTSPCQAVAISISEKRCSVKGNVAWCGKGHEAAANAAV